MTDTLAKRILRVLYWRGDLSPGTIANDVEGNGEHHLGISESVFVDQGLSEEFVRSWQELQKDGLIASAAEGKNAMMSITYDGGRIYQCPLATDPKRTYKSTRWWPMTFKLTEKGRGLASADIQSERSKGGGGEA